MGTTMVGMAQQGEGQPIDGARPTAESSRRAAGALEAAVLGVLWDATAALSPGEVREVLARSDSAAGALSYSTVVTILSRLHEKGSLSRERDGRAYRYAPVSDEAGLAARRLSQLLDRSANREAVLSRFVADLSERDEELLRSLLGEPISAVAGNGTPAATGDANGTESANRAGLTSRNMSPITEVAQRTARDVTPTTEHANTAAENVEMTRSGSAEQTKKRRGRG